MRVSSQVWYTKRKAVHIYICVYFRSIAPLYQCKLDIELLLNLSWTEFYIDFV